MVHAVDTEISEKVNSNFNTESGNGTKTTIHHTADYLNMYVCIIICIVITIILVYICNDTIICSTHSMTLNVSIHICTYIKCINCVHVYMCMYMQQGE